LFTAVKTHDVQFNLDEFIVDCKAYNELFELQKFLQILGLQVDDASEVRIDVVRSAFLSCGVVVDRNGISCEAGRLVQVLFGSLDSGLIVLYEMVLASRLGLVGIEYLLTHHQQWKRIVSQFFQSIDDGEFGPGVTFNLTRFETECREVNEKFSMVEFLGSLVENTRGGVDEGRIRRTFEQNGIPETEYVRVVESLCGEMGRHVGLFKGWVEVLERFGVNVFIRACK
jgi:hypothetical protein